MTTIASRISEVQAALDTLARQHKVPGASLGVLSGAEVVEFVTGVANKNTGAPVIPTTLFQIGSNTKLYTATLVMQLVDEGLVELDAPVKSYLPGLKLKDAKALDVITIRHLLTHTSGIEGDHFEDFGRGDDGIEKFVASLAKIGQITAPGELWSYCNTGWTMLGRVVEKLRGAPYHQVLREKLLAPIGARRTTILMEEMLSGSYAVGHMLMPGAAEPVVPPRVMMSPSHAPAGSMTSSTPAEVFRFVRMHLDGGIARDTTRVLSSASVKAMQQLQAKLPQSSLGTGMGLGWILSEWEGERVIGHGGGTIGQLSFLQVLPDRPFGVFLATNSNTGGALWRDLSRYLYTEFASVTPRDIPSLPPVAPKVDLAKYAGRYERLAVEIEMKVDDGKLVGEMKNTGPLAAAGAPPVKLAFRPVDKELFLANMAGDDTMAEFIDFDRQGRPRYLHLGGRASRRVDDGTTTKTGGGSKRARATSARAAARTKATPRKRPAAKAKRAKRRK